MRLAAGDGALFSVKLAFTPFTRPAGVSPSAYTRLLDPPAAEPHGPELPSTCTQSPKLPEAPSSNPLELMTAARDRANEVPFMDRAFSSAVNPVTSEIITSVNTGGGPTV